MNTNMIGLRWFSLFKMFCVLVPLMNVASALKGLKGLTTQIKQSKYHLVARDRPCLTGSEGIDPNFEMLMLLRKYKVSG